MKRYFIFLLTTGVIFFTKAQTKTWDGGAGTNNWADGNNWNPNGTPTNGNDIFIDSGDSVVISTAIAIVPDDITIQNGGILNIATGGSLATDNNGGNQGDLTITTGSKLYVTGGTLDIGNNFAMSGSSQLIISSGMLDIDNQFSSDNSSISISGGTLQTGNQTTDYLYLTGGSTLTMTGGAIDATGDFYADDATVNLNGGTYTGDDIFVYGTASVTQDGTDINANDIEITGDATLSLTSGTVTTDGWLYTDNNAVLNINTTITNTNGGPNEDIYIYGSSTVNIGAGADVSGYNDVSFDNAGAGVATLNVSGGSLSVVDDINLDNSANDQINISGGSVVVGDQIDINATNASISVTGGSLSAASVDDTSNGGGTVSDNIAASGSGTVSVNGTVVLPVELISFGGLVQNNQVVLTWLTAQELENAYFLLQKSADGERFSTISQIEGAGTTTEQTKYSFKDGIASTNVIYYRLIQVDRDGTETILPTISVQLNLNEEQPNSQAKLYPNPLVTEDLTVELSGRIIQESMRLIMIDLGGKIVLEHEYPAGTSLIRLNQLKNQLGSGRYILRIGGQADTIGKIVLIE